MQTLGQPLQRSVCTRGGLGSCKAGILQRLLQRLGLRCICTHAAIITYMASKGLPQPPAPSSLLLDTYGLGTLMQSYSWQ